MKKQNTELRYLVPLYVQIGDFFRKNEGRWFSIKQIGVEVLRARRNNGMPYKDADSAMISRIIADSRRYLLSEHKSSILSERKKGFTLIRQKTPEMALYGEGIAKRAIFAAHRANEVFNLINPAHLPAARRAVLNESKKYSKLLGQMKTPLIESLVKSKESEGNGKK